MTNLDVSAMVGQATPNEQALLDLLTQENPIWVPLPGPQTDAWLSEADELFLGGSAGGGKRMRSWGWLRQHTAGA